jgi:transposase
MNELLTITNEQINDLPLLLGVVHEMGIGSAIDGQIRPHGGWEGLSVGTLVSVWLCYLLMEHDHRLVSVRDWANARRHSLGALLGCPVRETDFSDDRLANVLTMLSAPEEQAALDERLVQGWVRVYALPTQTVRLDSTSVSVYHEPDAPGGLLRHGHSKDHRPDLAQFKAMLARLDPLGLPLACQVVAGQVADDGLYVPAYQAAVRTLGRADLLMVGDSKMGALATRGQIVAGGSAYLCAYRPPSATDELAGWVEDALAQQESWERLRQTDEQTGEVQTLAVLHTFVRPQTWEQASWTERVLVGRSSQQQAGLRRNRERALDRLCAQLETLRLPPARGRTVYRTRAALATVVADLLARAHLCGVVQVALVEQPHPGGATRWTIDAYALDRAAWQNLVDRLGWAVWVSCTTPDQYAAPALLAVYRQQVIQERGFSRLKTRNLHIRPLYLTNRQRIVGLTWLLCLALRVLTLTEYRLRTALAHRHERLAGLNPASRSQTTQRPTTERVIAAFQNLTLTLLTTPDRTAQHVTPLTATQRHVLALLGLDPSLYATLLLPAANSPPHSPER